MWPTHSSAVHITYMLSQFQVRLLCYVYSSVHVTLCLLFACIAIGFNVMAFELHSVLHIDTNITNLETAFGTFLLFPIYLNLFFYISDAKTDFRIFSFAVLYTSYVYCSTILLCFGHKRKLCNQNYVTITLSIPSLASFVFMKIIVLIVKL